MFGIILLVVGLLIMYGMSSGIGVGGGAQYVIPLLMVCVGGWMTYNRFRPRGR